MWGAAICEDKAPKIKLKSDNGEENTNLQIIIIKEKVQGEEWKEHEASKVSNFIILLK